MPAGKGGAERKQKHYFGVAQLLANNYLCKYVNCLLGIHRMTGCPYVV